jgi:hypothetical protein
MIYFEKTEVKSSLIEKLEVASKQDDLYQETIKGLLTTINAQYRMEPTSYDGSFQETTFAPELVRIVNPNFREDDKVSMYLRDAINQAEKMTHNRRLNSEEIFQEQSSIEPDKEMVKRYRRYFMKHNGFYPKTIKNPNFNSRHTEGYDDSKPLDYDRFLQINQKVELIKRGNDLCYFEVSTDKDGKKLPDNYVWLEVEQKWVAPVVVEKQKINAYDKEAYAKWYASNASKFIHRTEVSTAVKVDYPVGSPYRV